MGTGDPAGVSTALSCSLVVNQFGVELEEILET